MRGFGAWRPTALTVLLVGLGSASVAADDAAPDALVRAYPEQLAGYDATYLIWRDGTRMPLAAGQPSIFDQIRLPYPVGASAVVNPQNDPGRIRNRAFFDKMYGNCWKGEVTPRLLPVVWLPQSWGHQIRVTAVNSIAERLAEISSELDALPVAVKRYAYPPAGTYNCRTVADTGEPSMHSWGAAIDINAGHAEYWLWPRRTPADRMPAEIIDIFERHGFIWGGKWSHYDTMHFEYRPELVNDPSEAPRWAATPPLMRQR